MQSISASSSTWSPGFDTGAAMEMVPFDWKIDVHPEIHGVRHGPRRIDADRAERTMEVVGTGPVIGRRAQLPISLAVARWDQRVVDARR